MQRLLVDSPPTLPVFAVDLNPQRPGSKPTVVMGRIDRQKANGNLQYASVNNTGGWWAVDDIGFEVEKQPVATRHNMIFGTLFAHFTAPYYHSWLMSRKIPEDPVSSLCDQKWLRPTTPMSKEQKT